MTEVLAANGLDMVIDERFHVVRWVNEGMRVLAPVRIDDKEKGLRCVVIVAAGYHARVECKTRDFAHWFHIDDLRTEVER